MYQNAKRTRSIATGLATLCLSLLLTSCANQPALQAVYIPTPVTANLDLLCDPKAPEPELALDNGQLKLYVLDLHAQINECRLQQQAYRDEIARLVIRAKSRKVTP